MYFSTFSIVARDTQTGEIGVAGASHGFGYGSVVPHVEAGVGGMATQAVVNLQYAAEGMLELRDGRSAQDTMVHLLKNAPDTGGRHQMVIIDNDGNTACYTGENNYPFKGHISRMNFACAGNMLVNEQTLAAMADYFESSDEPFALRLIKSLQAGYDAGGDIRGIKSAAIKIVKGQKFENFWEGGILDLRTDENKNPLEKIERLYLMSQANILSNKGIDATDPHVALKYYQEAYDLVPDNPEYMLLMAKSFTDLGQKEEAEALLEKVKTYPGRWMEYWERLLKKD